MRLPDCPSCRRQLLTNALIVAGLAGAAVLVWRARR